MIVAPCGGGRATCLHSEGERVASREWFGHLQRQEEGLTSPHDQLPAGDLAGAVSAVVRLTVEVHAGDHCRSRKGVKHLQPPPASHRPSVCELRKPAAPPGFETEVLRCQNSLSAVLSAVRQLQMEEEEEATVQLKSSSQLFNA